MDPFTILAVIGVNSYITYSLNRKIEQDFRTAELEEELQALREQRPNNDND